MRTRMRRSLTTAALLLSTASTALVAQAAPAAADSPSPVETRRIHDLKSGCFTASYEDDTWASITVYYKNHCKKSHKLKIYWKGAAAGTSTIRVPGKGRGHDQAWFWASGASIWDAGR